VQWRGKFEVAEFQVGGFGRANNRPFTAGTRLPLVSGEQVGNKCVNFGALILTEGAVLVHRYVLAPADFPGSKDRRDSFAFQVIEQFALPILRHGRQFYSA
jgi:hypothetical protein